MSNIKSLQAELNDITPSLVSFFCLMVLSKFAIKKCLFITFQHSSSLNFSSRTKSCAEAPVFTSQTGNELFKE